ncbi:MAG TPA: MogA/MoaB family molybdenum cofactor biosynthesis protein [Thermoanaerobaculia bacterium]|nr:MogA/MoaB family molybdenum cofactor biosynthesis protein [Thermoanaerobaculia bacterium]
MPDPAHARTVAGPLGCAVLTVSDTRRGGDDVSGRRAAELAAAAGWRVVERAAAADDEGAIRSAVEALLGHSQVDVVILTGGTGVAPRDVTPEAVAPLLARPLAGFGELFRQLSFAEIGPAAMLSRATAGIALPPGGPAKALFALPGSPAAVELAVSRLILPAAEHLLAQARRGAPPGAL